MPLEPGSSQETISHNIGVERKAHPSMDPKQAAAIAYNKARGDMDKLDRICDAIGGLNARVDAVEAARKDAMTPEQKAERNRKAQDEYNSLSEDEKKLRLLGHQLREAKTRLATARGPQVAQSSSASVERIEKEIAELKKKLGV